MIRLDEEDECRLGSARGGRNGGNNEREEGEEGGGGCW